MFCAQSGGTRDFGRMAELIDGRAANSEDRALRRVVHGVKTVRGSGGAGSED